MIRSLAFRLRPDRTCLALLLCLSALTPHAASAAGTTQPEPDDRSAPRVIEADTFVLPEGERLEYSGDLTIRATKSVVIDGWLGPSRSDQWAGVDAPSLTIVAGEWIAVRSNVYPKRGEMSPNPGGDGGDGASLTLDAPVIIVAHSMLVVGDGDMGAPGLPGEDGHRPIPGGRGGDGGSIEVRGAIATLTGAAPVLKAGDGGLGGRGGDATDENSGTSAGGRGGDGGNARATDPHADRREQLGMTVWTVLLDLGEIDTLPRRRPAHDGAPAMGGHGGNGGDGGGDRWERRVAASPGGDAGDGGHAVGGRGGDGARGADACENESEIHGERGQTGGRSGGAVAGWGGVGGTGGIGNPSAHGGNGGSGGDATGLGPGNGGDGGNGVIPGRGGRAGKVRGEARAGDGGAGGVPGGHGGNGGNARAGGQALDGVDGSICADNIQVSQ